MAKFYTKLNNRKIPKWRVQFRTWNEEKMCWELTIYKMCDTEEEAMKEAELIRPGIEEYRRALNRKKTGRPLKKNVDIKD